MTVSTIHYQQCPCCGSSSIQHQLIAKDYTVSNLDFSIWHCQNCSCRFTQDIPIQSEIGAFYQSENYVSHSDTQKGFINKVYHIVRNITLQSKRKIVQQYTGKKSGSLLDVGAGTGAFSTEMKNYNWQVTGLEPDETARKVAFEKFKLALQSPEQLFQLAAHSYDAITMWHVLEHVHDLHGYLEQFQKITKADGKLFIAVPNYTSKDAAHYQSFWAAYDVPRHLYHFSPKSIDVLAQQHGFVVEKHLPMWFDSVYVSMLSEQYKNGGKGNVIAAILQGFVSNLFSLLNVKKCSSIIYILRKK